MRYILAKIKAKINSIINLDNIDKKLSNNQLVWVFENTWQKAVTKYEKNNNKTVSIINKTNIFILNFFKFQSHKKFSFLSFH